MKTICVIFAVLFSASCMGASSDDGQVKESAEEINDETKINRDAYKSWIESGEGIASVSERLFCRYCDKWIERNDALRRSNAFPKNKIWLIRLPKGITSEAGNALIEDFGHKKVPNIFACYERLRERTMELKQGIAETFPNPLTITKSDIKWDAFAEVSQQLILTCATCMYFHDLLCNFMIKDRLKCVSEKELAEIDERWWSIGFPQSNSVFECNADGDAPVITPLDDKTCDFAMKYAPETYKVYRKLIQYSETSNRLIQEIRQFCLKQNYPYGLMCGELQALYFHEKEVAHKIDDVTKAITKWEIEHRVSRKSAVEILDLDVKKARELTPFVKSMSKW